MATVVAENGSDLTVTEVAKLENLELVVESGLKSFIEVGRALTEIRDGNLYRATHMNFESYCQERWGMSESYAIKQMSAAETVDIIATDNCQCLPANESQARPLTKLPKEDRASAWQEAVEVAPNGKPTAAIVEEVVASRLPADKPEVESEEKRSVRDARARVEQEAQEFVDEFHASVDRICDGGVYTVETLIEATGINKTSIAWFVRMCDVSPSVKVHRNVGRKGLAQYSFEKTNCVTGHARIRQLAQQIADDSMSGAKAAASARKILSLLGG